VTVLPCLNVTATSGSSAFSIDKVFMRSLVETMKTLLLLNTSPTYIFFNIKHLFIQEIDNVIIPFTFFITYTPFQKNVTVCRLHFTLVAMHFTYYCYTPPVSLWLPLSNDSVS
jgi:hypothetical protein